MCDPALQNTIGAKPDSVEITRCLQNFVEFWDGEGGVAPGEPHQVTIRISRDDGLQDRFPSVGAVDVAGAQGAAFEGPKLVEDEQRVIHIQPK